MVAAMSLQMFSLCVNIPAIAMLATVPQQDTSIDYQQDPSKIFSQLQAKAAQILTKDGTTVDPTASIELTDPKKVQAKLAVAEAVAQQLSASKDGRPEIPSLVPPESNSWPSSEWSDRITATQQESQEQAERAQLIGKLAGERAAMLATKTVSTAAKSSEEDSKEPSKSKTAAAKEDEAASDNEATQVAEKIDSELQKMSATHSNSNMTQEDRIFARVMSRVPDTIAGTSQYTSKDQFQLMVGKSCQTYAEGDSQARSLAEAKQLCLSSKSCNGVVCPTGEEKGCTLRGSSTALGFWEPAAPVDYQDEDCYVRKLK